MVEPVGVRGVLGSPGRENNKKYGKLDLNQRPQGYEPCALPLRHSREECPRQVSIL